MRDESKVRDVAEAVKGVCEAVPVYQDGLQPAVREIGTTLGRTLRLLLAPLRGLVWGGEKIEEFVTQALEERLKEVPQENLITPNPMIAGPALESLRFVGHEPDLREMYATLLAKAMDLKTVSQAHPAFVDIIRQMTPDEARILKFLSSAMKQGIRTFPIISVLANYKNKTGYQVVLRNFATIGYESGCSHPEMTPSYLDNLNRLGLIEMPPDEYLTTDERYAALEGHPTVIEMQTAIKEMGNMEPAVRREMMKFTTFGIQFVRACVLSHETSSANGGGP